jgi:hypothetical protein
MFRTESHDSHFGAWVIQQIAAPALPLAWILLTARARELLVNSLGCPFGDIANLIWAVVFVWGSGLVLGFSVGVLFARAGVTGRLVWILPCVLYSCLFVWDVARFPLKMVLLGMFFGRGEEGWVVWLATFPTVSSILYAIGITLAERRSMQRRQHEPSDPVLPPSE